MMLKRGRAEEGARLRVAEGKVKDNPHGSLMRLLCQSVRHQAVLGILVLGSTPQCRSQVSWNLLLPAAKSFLTNLLPHGV